MSWQLKVMRVFLRHFARRALARQPDSYAARVWFERSAWLNARGRPYLRFIPDQIGGIDTLWTEKPALGAPFILYFHGGGYVMGNPRTHAALARYLARKAQMPVLVPDYRLAPEYPFPAAFDDALALWQGLCAQGYAPCKIALGGDSAGGGIALALLGHLCAANQPRPGCAFAFSPFTDLTYSGASITENAKTEILLPPHRLEQLRMRVLNGADPSDPRISPLFAQFPDAPPTLIQVARTEILRDDSRRMAAHLQAEGAQVTFQEWGNLPHVWQFFPGWLPEARKALSDAAVFIRQQLQASPSAGN